MWSKDKETELKSPELSAASKSAIIGLDEPSAPVETAPVPPIVAAAQAAPVVEEAKVVIPVPKAALNPQVAGYINELQMQTMRDMVREVFKELAPTLQAIAFTPEKAKMFADAQNADAKDAKEKRDAREKREKASTHKQIEDNAKQTALAQKNCTHRWPNGKLSLARIGNRPDGQALLICFKRHCMITPAMWLIDAPAPDGSERSHIQPAHPRYGELLQELEESMQG